MTSNFMRHTDRDNIRDKTNQTRHYCFAVQISTTSPYKGPGDIINSLRYSAATLWQGSGSTLAHVVRVLVSNNLGQYHSC